MSASPPTLLDAGRLHEAALGYLARYSSTEAGLRRILNRKIDRWARFNPDVEEGIVLAARGAADDVVSHLRETGLINDSAFAEMKAKSLVRSGQSNRSVQARLIAKGVDVETVRAVAFDDMETELAAALVMARRRRMGPFRSGSQDDKDSRLKELARLARGGFARDIAERALSMTSDEAEMRIKELRR